jgi:hypothetical protein
LGNRQFVSQDDFFIKNDRCAEQITIDVLIVPVDAGKQNPIYRAGHPYRKMAVHQNEKWFYCLYLP